MLNKTTTLSLRSQVSHELKTPISCLTMLIDFLARTDLTDEQKLFLRDISYTIEQLTKAQNYIDKLITVN
jgi:signal transduction histidine kinase